MYFRDTDKVYLKNAVHLSWSLIFNLFQSLTDIFPIEECLADSSWYTIKPISCNLCPLKGQTYLNKPAAFSCYLRCHLLLYTRLGVIGRSGVGDSACSQLQIFIFFIKENYNCAMTKYHVNNILLARNLSWDSDVRQWSHPLMIPSYCLWVKSNKRTRGQFEYDVLYLFLFWFDFVHSHARCGCFSIVCLRFQVMQIKQINWKMSTKKTFFEKIFCCIFLNNCLRKIVKPLKSRQWGFRSTLNPVRLFAIWGRRKREFKFFRVALGKRLASTNLKEVNGKPGKINELILKTKADRWPSFWLIGHHLERKGRYVWNGTSKVKGWKNFGGSWTKGWGGLEYWTIFMDVICVSSLK